MQPFFQQSPLPVPIELESHWAQYSIWTLHNNEEFSPLIYGSSVVQLASLSQYWLSYLGTYFIKINFYKGKIDVVKYTLTVVMEFLDFLFIEDLSIYKAN